MQTTIQEVSNQITETANRLEAVSSRIRTLTQIERTILLASIASTEPTQSGTIAVPRVRRRSKLSLIKEGGSEIWIFLQIMKIIMK